MYVYLYMYVRENILLRPLLLLLLLFLLLSLLFLSVPNPGQSGTYWSPHPQGFRPKNWSLETVKMKLVELVVQILRYLDDVIAFNWWKYNYAN